MTNRLEHGMQKCPARESREVEERDKSDVVLDVLRIFHGVYTLMVSWPRLHVQPTCSEHVQM